MTAYLGLTLRILMLICLAIFLVITFSLIAKSLYAKNPRVGNLVIPNLILTIEKAGIPVEQAFTSAEVSIGRDPESDLSVPNSTMSARHALFSYHDNQWWIEDLKSTNGSYLAGIRIEEPMVVKDGDIITCGEVPITIQIKTV